MASRRLVKPNIRGELTLAAAWEPQLATLEILAARGASLSEITETYQRTFPPATTRAQIIRSMRATQSIVMAQTAAVIGVEPAAVQSTVGTLPIDADLVTEIETGLARMVVNWMLDYARASITTVRPLNRRVDVMHMPSIPITINLGLPAANTNQEALVMLALEQMRKPRYGAEAMASLISHPATAAELAEATRWAQLAELAMFADAPTAEMLRAVDMITGRDVYTPQMRRERSNNATTRLARRTVTQTQGTASKSVQTSLDIDEYEWVSQRDGRVRPLHVTLDGESRRGKTFSWSNPDTHGEGNPGDPYGCRCVAYPVLKGKVMQLAGGVGERP